MEIKKIAAYPVREVKEIYKGIMDKINEKIAKWNDYNNYMPDICDIEFETDD